MQANLSQVQCDDDQHIKLDFDNEIVREYLNKDRNTLRRLYNEELLTECEPYESIIRHLYNRCWDQLKHKATSTPLTWTICQ